MKIQCDVCAAEEGAVFCTADEAALCKGCDHKVHQANKLATKHSRFSLLYPSSNDSPLCDICQEKRAFLFCKEDGAISCGECDFSIHQANELTQMHNRYLLTLVEFSTNSSIQFSTSPSSSAACQDSKLKPKSSKCTARNHGGADQPVVIQRSESNSLSNNSASSISDYLESLPKWHVEHYFDPSHNDYAYRQIPDPISYFYINLRFM